VAPPGFCNRGEVKYGSIGGLEYEVPQKLTHLLQCIGNLQGLVRYDFNRLAVYLSFRTHIGGSFPPTPPCGATGEGERRVMDSGGQLRGQLLYEFTVSVGP